MLETSARSRRTGCDNGAVAKAAEPPTARRAPRAGGSSPRPSRTKPGAGRGEILEAATREFTNRGYAGATTAGIARRAGLTQPLVHHHFGSKRGLWTAVLEALFRDLETEVSATVSATRDAPRAARLEALLRALARFSGRRPELARIIQTESGGGSEVFEELYDRFLGRWVRFYAREVKDAVLDGAARRLDARLAYFALVGAATALFAEPETARRAFGLDVRREATIERHADTVVDLLLRGFLRADVPGSGARTAPAAGRRSRRR
jgi:TetR/AcrR family transcriptional regulator